jgi:hypothetical protein
MGGANQGNGQQPLTATDLADIFPLFIFWSENDSISHGYAGKSVFNHAFLRMLGLMRAAIGKAAAQTPAGWISALPYQGTFNEAPQSGPAAVGYIQSLRETLADLIGDGSSVNAFNALPMSADCIGLGGTWSSTSGTWTGGDPNHMDAADDGNFARRAGIAIAVAALAAGWSDVIGSLPSGLPLAGGPKISHAYLSSTTTVTVTITHDAGDDLVVPLQAANGVGWSLMEGGSMASPGTFLQATACSRIDATHLLLTFPTIASPAASCQLFYPAGYGKIGRGDAVTDNFASVAKPAGYDIAADLGALWALNWPIQATTYGVTLSMSP